MNWKKVEFSGLYSTPSRNGLTRPSKVRGEGYKMINMGELFRYDRIGDIEMELVKMNAREIENSSVLENDLLFARQSLVLEGAGRCVIVKSLTGITTFESHLIRIRLDEQRANPNFYYYYFRSPHGRGLVKSIVTGTNVMGIRGSELQKLEVHAPPLLVQQRIASILSSYDDLIDNNRKRIALLEKAARMLYEEWFVRLQFPGHEHTSVVDGVPEGWERVLLPEAIDLNPRTKVAADGEKWFAEMSCLSNSSMVISSPVLKGGNSGSKFMNHDTLLARITPCLENGKTGYVTFLKEDESGFGSTEFIVLRGKKVPSQFVYCLEAV